MKITDKQLADELFAGSTNQQIATKYSMSSRNVQLRKARLAKRGLSPEHDMDNLVPEGFLLKGQSTYYNKEGKPTQRWVKSAIDRDCFEAMVLEFIEGCSEEVVKAVPIPMPTVSASGLLNCYILTDYHMGMLSWGEETGDDWDMDIAESLLVSWFRQAIATSPEAKTAIFAQLGDFLHWDGLDAVTPSSGHVLDADTRFQKLTRVAIRATKKIIGMLLHKHEHVHIVFAEGNHDMASSIWMREWLTVMYADEPRVTVDRSADPYYCYEHGNTSIFFHHGHKKRPDGISEVMAAKFRKVWGRTEHSYAHVGHLHHVKQLETSLMIVEQHPTLAAKDAYASRGGWLSKRAARVITYHEGYGEVSRLTITPDMCK